MGKWKTLCTALLMLAGLSLSLVACGGQESTSAGAGGSDSSSQLTTINFLQPLAKSTSFYPLFVGKKLGYFKEEGVRVNLLPASEEVPMTASIENGDADVAAPGASGTLQGLTSGADYDVVYEYYQLSAAGIVVPGNSEIKGVKALEGKTIGLASDEERPILQLALSSVGLSLNDVQTAVVGTSGPVVANSFKSGDIDAFVGAISDFAALEANGIKLRNITPEFIEKTNPAAVFIVSPSTIKKKEEALAGFMRAWAKATHVGFVNREVVAAMAKEEVPEEWQDEAFGQAFLDVSLRLQKPRTEQYGALRPKVWKRTQQQFIESGSLEQRVEVSKFLNDRFIDEANDWSREEVKAEARKWAEENL